MGDQPCCIEFSYLSMEDLIYFLSSILFDFLYVEDDGRLHCTIEKEKVYDCTLDKVRIGPNQSQAGYSGNKIAN